MLGGREQEGEWFRRDSFPLQYAIASGGSNAQLEKIYTYTHVHTYIAEGSREGVREKSMEVACR